MSDLTAPNGRQYIQPLGIFINNEWMKSSDGATLDTINPTYVTFYLLLLSRTYHQLVGSWFKFAEMSQKSPQSTQHQPKM
jgi:hypothetical protein